MMWSCTGIPTTLLASTICLVIADIFLARLRISARVIVHQNNAGRMLDDSVTEHFAGMRERRIEEPFGNRDFPYDFVGAVQQNDEKTSC